MEAGHKTIFITGAASGIGAATARRFADAGWFVGLFDIDVDGVRALAEEIGRDGAIARPLDVADAESWKVAVQAFSKATGGRLDVLLNNAGVLTPGDLEAVPVDRLEHQIAVNLTGPVLGVRACLPLLRATGNARIVNVASIAGLVAFPEAAIYSATKAGLRTFGEALSIALERDRIAISTIHPAFIDTPLIAGKEIRKEAGDGVTMAERAMAGGFHLYDPSSVAKCVWKMVTRDRREMGAGTQARYMLLMSNVAPWLMRMWWRRSYRRQARRNGH